MPLLPRRALRAALHFVAPFVLLLGPHALAAQHSADERSPERSIPAPRDFAHDETLWMGFHEASGYGTVELRPMLLAESPELRLQAMFVHQGRRLQRPPVTLSLAFHSVSDSSRFRESPSVTLVADGSSLRLGPAIRQVDRTGGRVRETVALRIPRGWFLWVTSAKRVTGRIDGVEFAIGDAQLEALRDLASRMTPAAHARALAALTAEGRAGGIELRKRVHDAADVDTPARPLLVRTPRFPSDSARTAPHMVRFEFVVDTSGRADPESLRLASPRTDSLYLDAIRAVLPDWEFEPATKDGARVAQRVRQAFTVPSR
jgi:hypothetical protein